MNLDQNIRWQHVALIAGAIGTLSGGMILAIGLSGTGTDRAAPWWVGAVVLACSASLGAFAFVSLRRAQARSVSTERLSQGPFELPQSASEAVVRLNARLASHFGLPSTTTRPPMPQTFGQLVEATSRQAQTTAAIQPAQHEAARATLANLLETTPDAIRWGSNPSRLIPMGRRRFQLWERVRADAPELPEAKLNPWVENIAIYGFLAALIAIAVPIAQQFDSDEATRVQPTSGGRVVGKAVGLLLFSLVIAVLMIPVYVIGKRYAARLPAEAEDMGAMARHFPGGESEWTSALVADHLPDLVSVELGIPSSSLREETPLRSVERRQ